MSNRYSKMHVPVTMYQSKDGKMHRSQEDAAYYVCDKIRKGLMELTERAMVGNMTESHRTRIVDALAGDEHKLAALLNLLNLHIHEEPKP